MFYTGLAVKLGERVVNAFGTKENDLMLGVMFIGGILSAICSNTGTAATLMPVTIGICAKAKLPVSRQLMPLAIGIAGGMLTMIGTPPNLIVTSTLTEAGLPTFGFFEFAWIGIPLLIVVIIYMMFI